MPGPEYREVELPFIQQLQSMGWEYVEGSLEDPAITGRGTFAQVFQEGVLREQLRRINRRDGKPWLNDERISQAVGAITRTRGSGLMEANQAATGLLRDGISVEGLPDWDGGRSQTIHYIDWENPANNRFSVINQFKVKCPPGFDAVKGHVIPDLVLLVNGIPLVVVEAKGRTVPAGLADAIDQLRRYTNQRKASGETEQNEGAPALFHTNQFLVATNFDDARVGTIGAGFDHFLNWKTVEPRTEAEVAAELGVSQLSSQQRLVAGMLDPANLLDIVRHYTLFMTVGGQTIKIVARYQQFRAVSKMVRRLKTGKTRFEDGEHDRRGGVVWHTQGSGKSLTMVFLIRYMRSDPELRRFKVVVVTDRKDLQDQLSGTASLTGETVEVASSTEKLKKLAARPGPGLLFATIQKYRDAEVETAVDRVAEDKAVYVSKPLPVLNESEDILVMVDEAHRGQAGDLHANLLQALPNAARLGFTGTPIIMGEKKRTYAIFGNPIDTYTIREAEQDGATVPVLYEGRTAKGGIKEGRDLDELFEDMFRERSREELEAIKQKYATKGQVLEAPKLIEEKALDMLRHYVTHILPGGLKAQVVAYSRRAAVRYQEALERARDTLLAEAMALSINDKQMDDVALMQRPPKVQAAVSAWRYQKPLRELEFATVISGSNNDTSDLSQWSDESTIKQNIKRFKKPLFHDDPDKADPLAFLIVKSMLLTGFDAPIEGVMYLDRPIREAELLQAIARVNRTGFGKQHGWVVDYYGVANHLKEALAAYSEDDIEGALQSLKDELPLLRDRHLRAVDVLRSRGVENLDDVEQALDVLADEAVRAEFTVKYKQFVQSLDEVLPRPEGLPYTADAKKLGYIQAVARNRFKDGPQIGKDVGAKVRKLIDDHVLSMGIDPKIPPVELTDQQFEEHVNRQVGPRAKASEMEHAIRSHIRKHMDEDPVAYEKLSERLETLLEQLDGQWEAQIDAFNDLQRDIPGEGDDGGDANKEPMPAHYMPFLRVLTKAKVGDQPPPAEVAGKLMDAAAELVDLIVSEISIPDFWSPARIPDQERLRGRIFEELMNRRLLPTRHVDATVDDLMDLAKSNHDKLLKA